MDVKRTILTICRVDIAGTCFLEKPCTIFPLTDLFSTPDTPLPASPWPLAPSPNPEHNVWKYSFLLGSPLIPVFHDLTTLILEIKTDSTRCQRLGGPPVSINQAEVSSIVIRLEDIALSIEDTTTDKLVQECCRVSALLLLGNIQNHFPAWDDSGHVEPVINIEAQTSKLHTILVKLGRYKEWVLLKPLLLWSLTLGALSTPNFDDQSDFLELMKYSGKWLGLHCWMEAMMVAGNLLWVSEIFDKRFKDMTADKVWSLIH